MVRQKPMTADYSRGDTNADKDGQRQGEKNVKKTDSSRRVSFTVLCLVFTNKVG